MLDSGWTAESIYYSLHKTTDRSKLLKDLDILFRAIETKEDRAFLHLAKPNDGHVDHLVAERSFAKAAMEWNKSDWALLDQMDRAHDIYLGGQELAHLLGRIQKTW